MIITFLLLARALRSLWLPVKALLLNLISLAAAFGVLTFVWQQGHGTATLFSSPATGAVTLWVPLAVFALLFGLSMDYEVFILTRITEEYEKTANTSQAVVRGIGYTGRLVTSGALCGLITACRLDHEMASAADKRLSKTLVPQRPLSCCQPRTCSSTSTC